MKNESSRTRETTRAQKLFTVRPLPELLTEEWNYAACELYKDDYCTAMENGEWVEVRNAAAISDGFFHEGYYDTENHAIEAAGMCLSVTDLSDGRRLVSLRTAEGTRYSTIVEGTFAAKHILRELDDTMLARFPEPCRNQMLRFRGGTAIQHCIRRLSDRNVYLVLSFEIVYGEQ